MLNFGITFHISGQLQPQSPSVEVVPNNNVLLSAKILNKTMNYRLRWRHINTCCRVMCTYAYVTIRRTLDSTCFRSRHFVNKVSGQHFSAENKQEAADFYHQHLPLHSLGVIWKTKSKSNFPVSFSLISAEMNLVDNYRTLRGLRTVNPKGGLPSTIWRCDQVEAEAELRGWQGFRGWARILSHAETTDHSRKLASALVCPWRRSGHVTWFSAWLIPHIFLK